MKRAALRARRRSQSLSGRNAKAKNVVLALVLPPALFLISAFASDMRVLDYPWGFLLVGVLVLVGVWFLWRALAAEWGKLVVGTLLYVPSMSGFLLWCGLLLVLAL